MRPYPSVVALALLLAVSAQPQAQSAAPRTIGLSPPAATLPAEFTSVNSVRELSDGRLLIADGGERKLVVADWSNGSVRQLGRNGSGPGEYVQPSTLLAIRGDSTILSDARNGRWLLLSGASIATTVGAGAVAIQRGARLPLGADDRGHVIFTKTIAIGGSASELPRRDSTMLIRVSRATGREETVAMLRARPTTISVKGPAANPTSVEVTINPLASGELATLFPDGWIAIARLDPYRIEWIAPDGTLIRGPSLPFERVVLDDRERRAFVERQAAETGRPARDPATFPEWPEIVPPFRDALLRAPDGRLWIRRVPTAAHPNPPYDVVDRRGVLVARVTGEKDVDVVGFGRGVVYTVMTDEDGIQHLQRRPLP
jgi:hypothetical protein